MNNFNPIMRNKGRRKIGVVLCVFLLTTSMVAMIGASVETSSSVSKSEAISTELSISKTSNDVADTLRYTFSFIKPGMEEIELHDSAFTKINMRGCIALGKNAGEPALPVKFVKLLLPPRKTVKSIDVDGEPVEVELKGIELRETPIIPYQNSIPIGKESSREFEFNVDLYSSFELYPSSNFKEHEIGYSHGYAILDIGLSPVQYNPGKGDLFYYPEMTVSIELEEDSYVNPFYRNNIGDAEWVQNLVFNPEIIESYDGLSPTVYPGGLCDPGDDYDYVIITTTQNGLDHWVTTPSIPYNWTSLMDKHYTDDGLSCTLVTVQDIDDCDDYQGTPPFNDQQAHVREFCKDAYEDWGTSYIFVGGDAEWIPARLMDYEYEIDCDSDLYWSNLDNTFNADGDSAWGEEGDAGFDLYSELFIGRITCDTPQDVSNWMKKSFYYADSTDKDFLDNAAFYGGDTGWDCEGDDFIDYSAIKGTNDWLGPIPGADGPYPSWAGFQFGFETWNSNNPGLEYDLTEKWTAESPNPGGWMGGSESAAIAGLTTAINNDDVTLISGIAHANEYMSLDVGYTAWESNYHNTKPFFLHDYGCHCGDMDAADDGVLHSMLFYSDTELAFACIYHTSYGWGNFDSTNSSSALQQKLFWDYMFDTANNSGSSQNWQLGKALAFSKDAMAPTIDWTTGGAPGSWRGTIEACLLFGDPAQRIKPPAQPEHNIGIQEFDVSSHEPADTDIWVNATLYNNGMHDETAVEVRFLVDDVEEDSTTIPLFEKDTIMDVGWLYHTPTMGWETLCVNVTLVPGENLSLDNVKCQDVIYGPDIAVSQINAPDYLGQGFAKPVTGYVENLGPTDETVTVEFYANDMLEDSTSIYLTSGSSDWVTFMWDGTTSGLGTYDVVVHAVPVTDETYLVNQNKSHTVTVFEAIGNILLVDDDDGDSYETWYENALMACYYIYDIWDRSTQPSPTPMDMQGYTAVIWLTGSDYDITLGTDDQTNLANYLDAGGKLFISGQDIGYDIGPTTFYSNYLHATYQVDTAGWNLVGETGDVIGDGLSFAITSGDGANNQIWPDGISPISPAQSCFYYSDSIPNKAGLRVQSGPYRIVYFSFGFEAIDNMADRTTVMSRVLAWLAAGHDIAVINLDVEEYIPHNELVDVEATIVNGGINDESDILVNFTVDGVVEDSTIISSLNAGQSTLVSFPWLPDVGTYVVGIEARPVPGEDIISNNAMYKTVHVVPSPDIWVDPANFTFNLNEGVTVVDTLTIGNEPTAEGTLEFEISYAGVWGGGWIEQWSHTYGGSGHSQFAQPVGDIDEDGQNETLVGGYASDTVIILSYNPVTETYDQEYEWSEGAGVPSGVCVVDLDGNGDLEFAVSWVYGYANGVYAYDWDGTSLTELDYYSGTGFDFAFDVYACDYDEDDDVEVLIANDIRSSGTYHVTALGWSAGSFVYEASWGSGESTENPMIWSGDTDGDGDIEVIVTASSDTVHVLNWDGGSWNADIVASGLPSHPYAVVAGDIDGDGIDEIGIGLEGTDAYIYGWDGGSYVQVWHSNYPGEEDIIEAMYFGDADNDGSMELLVGTDDVHVIGYSGGYYYEESVITQTDGQLSSAIIADMDDDGENEVKACDIIVGPGKEWIVEWRSGWLSVSPMEGSVAVGNQMDLDVMVNTAGLDEGEYHAFIVVTSNDFDESLIYIPVNLSVAFGDDVGVVSINYPTAVIPPGPCVVNATVENFGSMDQTDVLVNCSIFEGFSYEEDFENDDGGYTVTGYVWEWGTPTDGPGSAHSGSYCWGTDLDGDYPDYANAKLDSIPIDLPAGMPLELSLWHWYDIESYWDGGNVKISTDGGSTWSILGSYLGPYPEDAASGSNSGIPGEPCFSGLQDYWDLVTFDLSSYAGETVIIRWHFGSDTTVNYAGWYIDDVMITSFGSVNFDDNDPVYSAETTVSIPSHITEDVEFTPPWDATPGNYSVKVMTLLPGDEDPSNDYKSITITINTTDTTPPEITNVQDSPDPQETGGWVNITCTVTDNVDVDTVKVNITNPDFSDVNQTMTNIPSTDTYYYNTTYSTIGTYSYHVWANDTGGNENTSDTFSFTIEPAPNNPPYAPSNPDPYDGEICVSVDANLSWTGGDPDPEDTVMYDVYFGTTSPPPQVAWDQLNTSYDPGTMDWATQYYWQIVADDGVAKETTPGPIWSFTTENKPTIVSIMPSDQTVEKGEIFTVDVYVDAAGNQVKGLKFETLYYNASLIHCTYDNITNLGGVVFNGWFAPGATMDSVFLDLTYADNGAGELHVVFESRMSGFTINNASWVTIEFQAQDNLGTSNLDLAGVEIVDPGYNQLPCTVNNGNVTVIESDITPPEITEVTVTHSDPKDTDSDYGWENFTCTVTDNNGIDTVKLVLIGDITTEYIMVKDGDDYYLNVTISTADEYTYHIWANDTNDNYAESPSDTFPLPLNADVDEDGSVGFVDIMMVAGMWNVEGPNGWDRADVDNSGEVGFVDIMCVAGKWGQEW